VRVAPDGDLILDLDSVVVYGQRYSLATNSERIESSREGSGANRRTGEYVGGGALLGSIIGAIAGAAKAQPSEQPRERPPARADRSSPAAASSACQRNLF
jgi:hypothetical protein